MRLIGIVVLILGIAAIGECAPLPIQNADFEVGEAALPTAWSWWSRTDHGSAEWVDTDAHGGKHSVRIAHEGPRDWAFSSSTRLAVKPGDGLRVSAWAKVDDPEGVGFNVYRQVGDEEPQKRNPRLITKTTDFVDKEAPQVPSVSYRVRPVVDGREGVPSIPASVGTDAFMRISLQGNHRFQKVGIADLDGDGRYDYVIKQPGGNVDPYVRYWKKSPETFKLEAYNADGELLWRYDLGWSIERGIWYSPYIVYDFDGDGKAEVAVKTGEGDPRDADGRVQSGPEYLTILDGMTGKPVTRIDWISRSLFENTSRPYNYASRNQLGMAFLDGKTPCLIVERGTYNVIVVVAYALQDGELRELWQWDNRNLPRRYRGQGAHSMHSADVDGDGRDEVIIGSVAIDDNGDSLWTTGLGYPDHHFVGDIDPLRPGLEIYYGIESRQKKRNGMCLVDAATGEILWGHEGPTRHVHSIGMCSDIDSRYPGAECYSADTDEEKKADRAFLRTAEGKELSTDLSWRFGPLTVYWDADPQREILWRRRISDYGGAVHEPEVQGRVIAAADILGDWREEIVTSVEGEIRIYTTRIPAVDRRPCLMTDPIYRIDVAHAAMGYSQVPMLSYDLASRRAAVGKIGEQEGTGGGSRGLLGRADQILNLKLRRASPDLPEVVLLLQVEPQLRRGVKRL